MQGRREATEFTVQQLQFHHDHVIPVCSDSTARGPADGLLSVHQYCAWHVYSSSSSSSSCQAAANERRIMGEVAQVFRVQRQKESKEILSDAIFVFFFEAVVLFMSIRTTRSLLSH